MIGIVCAFFHTEGKGFYSNAFKDTISKVYGLGPKQQDTLFQCIIETYAICGIQAANPSSWDNEAPTFEQVYQTFTTDYLHTIGMKIYVDKRRVNIENNVVLGGVKVVKYKVIRYNLWDEKVKI